MTDPTKPTAHVHWPTLADTDPSTRKATTPTEDALRELKELERYTGPFFPGSDQPTSEPTAGTDLPPAPVPIDAAAERAAYAELLTFFRDNPEPDTQDLTALSEEEFAKGLAATSSNTNTTS